MFWLFLYLLLGTLHVLWITQPEGSFVSDYVKGKYSGTTLTVLTISVLLFWPLFHVYMAVITHGD